jgi:hypothetical protein
MVSPGTPSTTPGLKSEPQNGVHQASNECVLEVDPPVHIPTGIALDKLPLKRLPLSYDTPHYTKEQVEDAEKIGDAYERLDKPPEDFVEP